MAVLFLACVFASCYGDTVRSRKGHCSSRFRQLQWKWYCLHADTLILTEFVSVCIPLCWFWLKIKALLVAAICGKSLNSLSTVCSAVVITAHAEGVHICVTLLADAKKHNSLLLTVEILAEAKSNSACSPLRQKQLCQLPIVATPAIADTGCSQLWKFPTKPTMRLFQS